MLYMPRRKRYARINYAICSQNNTEVKIMSIKEKISSAFKKAADKTADTAKRLSRKSKTDSELAADEVIHEEVFPKKRACKKGASAHKACAKKPASKRTRPTNNNYEMIDPDDNTCDSSKS